MNLRNLRDYLLNTTASHRKRREPASTPVRESEVLKSLSYLFSTVKETSQERALIHHLQQASHPKRREPASTPVRESEVLKSLSYLLSSLLWRKLDKNVLWSITFSQIRQRFALSKGSNLVTETEALFQTSCFTSIKNDRYVQNASIGEKVSSRYV
jgi:hypothetical protein